MESESEKSIWKKTLANTNEGFTGTYIGMYASSNGTETTNYADYDWFLYHGED